MGEKLSLSLSSQHLVEFTDIIPRTEQFPKRKFTTSDNFFRSDSSPENTLTETRIYRKDNELKRKFADNTIYRKDIVSNGPLR